MDIVTLYFSSFILQDIAKQQSANADCCFCVGTALFSRAVTRQVFSTLVSLTSVFGMGTGGSSPPLAPTI